MKPTVNISLDRNPRDFLCGAGTMAAIAISGMVCLPQFYAGAVVALSFVTAIPVYLTAERRLVDEKVKAWLAEQKADQAPGKQKDADGVQCDSER